MKTRQLGPRDPLQTEAQKLLPKDLRFAAEAMRAYESARPELRRQIRLELAAKLEASQPGHTSGALTALVAAIGTGLTLLATLSIALFNGWVGAVTATVDSRGRTQAVTTEQADWMFGNTLEMALILGGAIVLIALVMLLLAAEKDRNRGVVAAWLEEFERIELDITRREAPQKKSTMWFLTRPRSSDEHHSLTSERM